MQFRTMPNSDCLGGFLAVLNRQTVILSEGGQNVYERFKMDIDPGEVALNITKRSRTYMCVIMLQWRPRPCPSSWPQ